MHFSSEITRKLVEVAAMADGDGGHQADPAAALAAGWAGFEEIRAGALHAAGTYRSQFAALMCASAAAGEARDALSRDPALPAALTPVRSQASGPAELADRAFQLAARLDAAAAAAGSVSHGSLGAAAAAARGIQLMLTGGLRPAPVLAGGDAPAEP